MLKKVIAGTTGNPTGAAGACQRGATHSLTHSHSNTPHTRTITHLKEGKGSVTVKGVSTGTEDDSLPAFPTFAICASGLYINGYVIDQLSRWAP